MPDFESVLLVAALLKWSRNEPVSVSDFNRIVNLINSIPLRVETPTKDQEQGAYALLLQTFNARYQSK